MRCRATSACHETTTLQPLLLKKSLKTGKDHRRHPSFTGKSTPFPAHARFLEGPQGAQRRLLCLGNTPDAGDSEPLVRPVSPQRLQRLATLKFLEHDSSVIPATGEPAAIGAHFDR